MQLRHFGRQERAVVEHQNCNDGYPVISCEYQAGHTFAPNSGDTIWDFFSQF